MKIKIFYSSKDLWCFSGDLNGTEFESQKQILEYVNKYFPESIIILE